jgi:polar amino acid transport system substrate-binding protein
VLVLRGGIMHDTLLRRYPGISPVPAETHAELLRRLAAGDAPWGLMAKLPGLWLIRELRLSGVGPVGPPVSVERYGFAVRKGNAALAARLEAGLARLRETGAYQELYGSWLGVLEPRGMTWREVMRYGAVVFVPLLLWLAGLAAWSASLKRQVDRRSAELKREIAERRGAEEELRRNEAQLVQADKLAALGALVAGVARGIDEPNGRMLEALPLLQAAWRDAAPALEERYAREGDFALGGMRWSRMREEVPRILEDMQGSARRVRRIAEDLHGFARPAGPEGRARVELDEVARTALRLLDGLLRKSTTRLSVELAPGATPVRGSAQRIEQVVVNLVMNACQALPDASRAIAVRTFADPARRAACREVRDEGVGVPPEHLARLADPFFTTKRERGGTGLGLSVSAGIAQEHGGWLQFESEPGRGTTARLWLPLSPENPAP